MDTKRTPATAGKLVEAKRGFDQWRRNRKHRERIPDQLWQMAVEAATVHGVHPTARRLRLCPATLKERMQTFGQGEASEDGPRFVEFPVLGAGLAPECILEAEDQGGRKLRIQLKGGATAQAASLGRMLWRGES